MEAEKPAEADAAALPGGKPIALVGLMGAGKTTIGRRLAARLGLPFVDADVEIEQAAGMTISEIFDRFGEPHFRDGERRVIARLMESGPCVLATGGGAFCDPATRALMLERGLVIWLDADIPTLTARVARRSHRPLLVGRDAAEVLSELATIRNPLYAEAHLRIESRDAPMDETVDRILDRLAGAAS